MELKKKYKTLDYNQFDNDVKKCLSPIIAKLSKENTISCIENIKNLFHSYDKINSNIKKGNIKISKENKIFQEHMNKYQIYKKFIENSNKHKNNAKKISQIDNLVLEYLKKGYKVPNISHNLFKKSPLNYSGLAVRNYFNKFIKEEKRQITDKEKNLDFLYRLHHNVKTLKKMMHSKDYAQSPNKNSTIASQDASNFESPENSVKYTRNFNNSILRNIHIEEKKRVLSEKKKLSKNNTKNSINNLTIYLQSKSIDNDENFNELNDYEKKRIKNLIKEADSLKSYKGFVEKALTDKNFFKIIDNNDIDLTKINQIKQNDLENEKVNSFNSKINKKKSSISIKKAKKKVNFAELDETSLSSPSPPELSSSKSLNLNKNKSKENVPLPVVINDKHSILQPQMNYIRNNKDHKKTVIGSKKYKNKILAFINQANNSKGNKRLSFPINPFIGNKFLKTAKENNTININITNINNNNNANNTNNANNMDNSIVKKSSFKKYKIKNLKRCNTLNFKSAFKFNTNKYMKKEDNSNKEENLNALYNKINTQINADDNFISEFKKYFIKNKDISEKSLDKYINRKYEINDFINFCSTIDQKVKSSNIMNNWKRNYLKIGKLDERKAILKEEGNKDYVIKHSLHDFLNSIDGKRKYYEYKCDDFDLNQQYN